MNCLNNKNKLNKNGSSIILLAMVFVTMMLAITASIAISRALVVKSECEAFGRLWTKSILSEYDVNLLKEYGIMAYFGNDAEIQKKIDAYLAYSSSGKLDATIGKSSSELMGYELGDPDNFRKALKLGFAGELSESVINDSKREKRDISNMEDDYGDRTINNNVVIDTMPSQGISNTIDTNALVSKLNAGLTCNDLLKAIGTSSTEIMFIKKNLGNHITIGESKNGYFCNEWEYILNGKYDDNANFKACKNKIFIIRNAMNLAFLYKDPEKHAVIVALAEALAPGVAGVLTEAVIAEIWAAIETEVDLEILMDNGRVPFMKTSATWRTSISSVLGSKEVSSQLSKEGTELLRENKNEIESMDGSGGGHSNASSGQNYDDYLLAMIMTLNDNVRVLRIMDLVQINFKHWYYRDFNMMEYYIGTRFSIKANGRSYDFEDSYK